MKTSGSILLLTPLVFTLTLATPIAKANPVPLPATDYLGECYTTYCLGFSNAAFECGKANGIDMMSLSGDDLTTAEGKKFIECYCGGEAKNLFDKCMPCHEPGDPSQKTMQDGYDLVCNGEFTGSEDTSSSDDSKDDRTTGTGDSEDDTETDDTKEESSTGTTENKKNDAGSLTLGKDIFRMAGMMVLAGGVIAAM